MSKALWVPLQLSLGTFACFYSTPLFAQITSDGTVNTQVNQNDNVAEITGGETRGGNLFHSFQDFSVRTGNQAFFNNAESISNIFSRVTGGNISNIDGLIRANGDASLFLINPAGIVFGENARLDIGGSFYGSTASSILFEDGEFSAVDNIEQPILTINAPIGLSFRDEPGDIINRSIASNGKGLEVNSGNNLNLLGGNVNFDGGIATAPGGKIELGGLSAAGEISIENNDLNFSDGVERADVSLSNGALVKVRAGGGGFININARNLSLSESSILLGGIESDSGSPDAQAGDISINAESIFAEDNSLVSTVTEGVGNAGNIFITATNIEFTDEIQGDDIASVIDASTLGQGDGGNIEINASNVSFDGSAGGAVSNVGLTPNDTSIPNAIGNAGDIIVNTDSLFLSNGAGLSALTGGQGNGGNITVNANNIVSADGRGDEIPSLSEFFGFEITRPSGFKSIVRGAFADDETSGTGDAGIVEINAADVFFTNGAGIVTSTVAQGNAGDIVINATGTIELDNAGEILSQVIFEQGNGDAGNVTITTDRLLMNGFSQIQSDTQQDGDAGVVKINANEISLTERSFINSGTGILGSDVEGDGGNIEINTNKLFLANTSTIEAFTSGTGNAGDIIIQAKEEIILDDSSAITSDVRDEGQGTGGNIFLTTPLLSLNNSSRLSTSTFEGGAGDAGSININASEQIEINSGSFVQALTQNDSSGGNINFDTRNLSLVNNGEIFTSTEGNGNAGNINLQITEDIVMEQNSFISAQAFEEGNGGNLTIDSRFIVAFPNGNNDILASAEQGQGGNITINADSLLGIRERPLDDLTNDINASSRFSFDGNVRINTPDVNPVGGIAELPNNVVEPEQTTQQACEANRETAAKNGLTISGKGGLVPDPGEPLESLNAYVNGESTSAKNIIPAPIETAQGTIQPARGAIVTESGEVILTAYRTHPLNQRVPETRRCS